MIALAMREHDRICGLGNLGSVTVHETQRLLAVVGRKVGVIRVERQQQCAVVAGKS